MSDDYQERLKRFTEKYPFEYILVWKVAEKFNEIYDYTNSISNFKGYGKREVRFNVEQEQNGSLKFTMSEEGMFFVGALSMTIENLQSIFISSLISSVDLGLSDNMLKSFLIYQGLLAVVLPNMRSTKYLPQILCLYIRLVTRELRFTPLSLVVTDDR